MTISYRLALLLLLLVAPAPLAAQRTQKPPLHARHWIAITGKPLAATAGAMMFARRAATRWTPPARCSPRSTTMWDVLSWGGETQALIYHPKLKKVIGINALGVAPTGRHGRVLPVARDTATRPSTARSPPSRPARPAG